MFGHEAFGKAGQGMLKIAGGAKVVEPAQFYVGSIVDLHKVRRPNDSELVSIPDNTFDFASTFGGDSLCNTLTLTPTLTLIPTLCNTLTRRVDSECFVL